MIELLFKRLRPVILYVIRHPLAIFFISSTLTAGGFLLAANLHIDNDLSKLVPEHYPSVIALNKLKEQVGAEHEATIAIQSPDFDANRKYGNDFVDAALKLLQTETGQPYFVRAEFRRDIDFIKRHALYFATDNELDLLVEYLESEIGDAQKKANPFYFDLDEEPANTDSLSDELNSKYEELVGSEYLMSAASDSKSLIIINPMINKAAYKMVLKTIRNT